MSQEAAVGTAGVNPVATPAYLLLDWMSTCTPPVTFLLLHSCCDIPVVTYLFRNRLVPVVWHLHLLKQVYIGWIKKFLNKLLNSLSHTHTRSHSLTKTSPSLLFRHSRALDLCSNFWQSFVQACQTSARNSDNFRSPLLEFLTKFRPSLPNLCSNFWQILIKRPRPLLEFLLG